MRVPSKARGRVAARKENSSDRELGARCCPGGGCIALSQYLTHKATRCSYNKIILRSMHVAKRNNDRRVGGCIEWVNVYASTESVCSSSNFGRARRMFIFSAAVSANSHVSVKRVAQRCSRQGTDIPIVGSCTISKMYVFLVIPSSTAVNSGSSISSAWNSSRMRAHECFSALISSLVRS